MLYMLFLGGTVLIEPLTLYPALTLVKQKAGRQAMAALAHQHSLAQQEPPQAAVLSPHRHSLSSPVCGELRQLLQIHAALLRSAVCISRARRR